MVKIDQKPIRKRILLTIPLLGIGAVLTQADVTYLVKEKIALWIAVVPATFMSAVSMTYILMAPEGFKSGSGTAYQAA